MVLILLNLTFSFPTNHTRRREWCIKLRRQDFTVKARTLLCSDHFLEKFFDRTGQTVRLKDDAVPTVFNFLGYLKKEST